MANKTSKSTLIQKPTIIFVPFFGGEAEALQKHFDYVEDLGYQSKFVPLNFDPIKFLRHPISSRTGRFGMKSVWADNIEQILNETKGQKIIYSFSNPTVGALEAIARRKSQDVLGLIADGGPSGEVWSSVMGYYTVEKPVPTWPLKAVMSTAATILMEPDFRNVAAKDLSLIPKGFPILSIRGWKDPMITPRQIDMVFEPHTHLNWQKLSLPEAEHLNGLRDFPKLYKAGVEKFLGSLQ